MSLFITALGLMMVFEGIPYFCFPARFKEWASKISQIPDGTLRIIGLVVMILGLGLVYIGKSLTQS